jgi:hypothetical protein
VLIAIITHLKILTKKKEKEKEKKDTNFGVIGSQVDKTKTTHTSHLLLLQ